MRQDLDTTAAIAIARAVRERDRLNAKWSHLARRYDECSRACPEVWRPGIDLSVETHNLQRLLEDVREPSTALPTEALNSILSLRLRFPVHVLDEARDLNRLCTPYVPGNGLVLACIGDLLRPLPAPDSKRFVPSPGELNGYGYYGLSDPTAREALKRTVEEDTYQRTVALYDLAESIRKYFVASASAEYGALVRGIAFTRVEEDLNDIQMLYEEGDHAAISTLCALVFERSQYPEGFPQQFRVMFLGDSRQLVIEYEVPSVDIIPTTDKLKEIKVLYQDVISAIALRTISEALSGDYKQYIETVVFNGFVRGTNRATGRDIQPHILSARVTRRAFEKLVLDRVDRKLCLRNLGALVSPEPAELIPVKPLVEFNMVDRRYVDQPDVLSELDSRPNLMELTPAQFEALVANLFSRMGLETKLTRTHRDGGVDAVAYDTRPILGGKVVIQAKRYSNTVGVSAVRDLFGAMNHEGANKGILVSTSGYGPDAYEFIKDKPIELIDGAGLLYYLEQAGVKARIVFLSDTG